MKAGKMNKPKTNKGYFGTKSKKSGSRHPLLLYRRTMDRVWKATFFLGLLLAATVLWSLLGTTWILDISSDVWLGTCAVLCLAFSAFAFITRFMAYIQVFGSHVIVQTPFLHLNISYRRVHSAHPSLMQQIFPDEESNWAQRNYLAPFYGKTALVLELNSFPMKKWLLKLFLPAQMFYPQSKGMVFMVPDWMKLSTEFDSFYGAWMETQSRATKTGNVLSGTIRVRL